MTSKTSWYNILIQSALFYVVRGYLVHQHAVSMCIMVCHQNFGLANFGPADQYFRGNIGPPGPKFRKYWSASEKTSPGTVTVIVFASKVPRARCSRDCTLHTPVTSYCAEFNVHAVFILVLH